MQSARPPLSEKWLLVFGLTVVVWLIFVVFAPTLPPEVACHRLACSEAREWIATLLTFFIILGGLYQYMQAQRWKRAEWIAGETSCFFADPEVKNALHMLDWNGRVLPTLGNVNIKEETFEFHSRMLLAALYSRSTLPKRPGTGLPRTYKPHELVIRDCFDRMLDRLERFQVFVECGLVRTQDLKPYLGYWIQLIGQDELNPRKSRQIIRRLWVYIDEHGYERVQKLCAAFGYDITPNDTDRQPGDVTDEVSLKSLKRDEPELTDPDEDAGG